MRLIESRTLKLKEFPSEKDVKYAILSHRWEDEEVSLQEIQTPEGRHKKGFVKVQRVCYQARCDGFEYVWVDTCCIDKTSSAELTEAINSMYRWYQRSQMCYAYLSDVRRGTEEGSGSFPASAWFSRGWTLQELLAPRNVRFYDQTWTLLGDKKSLGSFIVQRTEIDIGVLSGNVSLLSCSVAQRMSWASEREVTRDEDKAYSMLGIFDVNMPMLYGEGGERAFLRLQEEIIRRTDDYTIFAWPMREGDGGGLLAPDSTYFSSCRSVKRRISRQGRSAYSMTNRGLSLELNAIPYSVDTYLVFLHCFDRESHRYLQRPCMGIFLQRLDEDDQYLRVSVGGKSIVQFGEWQREYIESQQRKFNVRQSTPVVKPCYNGFRIDLPGIENAHIMTPNTGLNSVTKVVTLVPGLPHMHIMVDLREQQEIITVIKLGFDVDFNPLLIVATRSDSPEQDRLDASEMELTFAWKDTALYTGENACTYSTWNKPWMCALRGDRIWGETMLLVEHNKALVIKRVEFKAQLIWEVFLV